MTGEHLGVILDSESDSPSGEVPHEIVKPKVGTHDRVEQIKVSSGSSSQKQKVVLTVSGVVFWRHNNIADVV